MNLWILVPLLAAFIIIVIFILNQAGMVSFDKMNSTLARVLVGLSFLVVFVFVIWFVLQLFPLPSR